MKNNLFHSRSCYIFIFFISALIIIAVVATALPQDAQATVKCVAYYTVKEGDGTRYIAQTFGIKWGDIAKANKLKDDYKLKPGKRLCIPDQTSIDKLRLPKQKGNLSVNIVGDLITVTASSFPKKNVFVVKVRDGYAYSGGWHRLGRLKATKKDSTTKLFEVPKELNDSLHIQVCMKSHTTDELICRMVFHIPK